MIKNLYWLETEAFDDISVTNPANQDVDNESNIVRYQQHSESHKEDHSGGLHHSVNNQKPTKIFFFLKNIVARMNRDSITQNLFFVFLADLAAANLVSIQQMPKIKLKLNLLKRLELIFLKYISYNICWM